MWESADEAAAGLVTMTIWLLPLKDLIGCWLLDGRMRSWPSTETPTLFILPVRGTLGETPAAERNRKCSCWICKIHVSMVEAGLLRSWFQGTLCHFILATVCTFRLFGTAARFDCWSRMTSFCTMQLCLTSCPTCCDELGAGFSLWGGGFGRFWAGLLVLRQLDGHRHLTQVNRVLPRFGLCLLLHYKEGSKSADLVLVVMCNCNPEQADKDFSIHSSSI